MIIIYKKEGYYPYWDGVLNTSWNNSPGYWNWKKVDEIENNKCKRP